MNASLERRSTGDSVSATQATGWLRDHSSRIFDERKGVLCVTKARVLRRDKDRTKTQEDRNVDLTPRALQVLKSHLELRATYVAAGKINHDRLFFLEDGSAISDPEVTRWRWNESLQKIGIRQRGPYHARHSSVTVSK
jgi:integrase